MGEKRGAGIGENLTPQADMSFDVLTSIVSSHSLLTSFENFINELYKKKEKSHKERAALPIDEKIKILVKLEELYVGVQKHRGIKTDKIIWKL